MIQSRTLFDVSGDHRNFRDFSTFFGFSNGLFAEYAAYERLAQRLHCSSPHESADRVHQQDLFWIASISLTGLYLIRTG